MKYQITHITRYEYEHKVGHAQHLALLCPRATATQRVESAELTVLPGASLRHSGRDFFGNVLERFELREPHRALVVTARSVVEVAPQEPPARCGAWDDDDHERLLEREPTDAQFLFDSPMIRCHRSLAAYARDSFTRGRDLVEAVRELNHRIYSEFTYDPRATQITTPLSQVLRERRGVCQDFAHLAVGCLRSLGLPARYVSGYLETRPPPGKPRLVGADASHAWASVRLPSGVWLDLDPTNDVLPGDRHVTLAWGRDFSDVSPLRGVVLGGGGHRLSVSVDTAPLSA